MMLVICVVANAQYTQNDIGKDCNTYDGKMGTVQNVTRTTTQSNNSSNTYNSTTSSTVGMNGTVGIKNTVEFGGNANWGTSSGTSNSRSTQTSTSTSYTRPECVEDTPNSYPRSTPVPRQRW